MLQLALLATSLVVAQSGDAPQKVAVPDFAAPAGQEALGVMLSGVVAHELERLQLFKVTTAEQVRVVLSNERQKQLLGCVDESCGSGAASAASMLGVDLLVTGRLTKLGGKKADGQPVTLDMTLLDAKTGGRKGSTLVNAASESELIEKLPEAVLALVGKVLEGKQGALVVTVSETGATVKIDGTIVGTTPLEGRLALTAGPHALRVEKEGFVSLQKEVRVAPDKLSEESLRMVPSPDFAASYEAKEGRLRLGAWLSAGAAVAGVGLFTAMQIQANNVYGSSDQVKGTFLYERKALVNGVETEVIDGATVDHRALATQYKSQIQTYQLISYVGGGVGLAAAIASVAFFVSGDDPGKYRQYKTTAVPPPGATPAPAPAATPAKPKMGGLLMPGGGALVLSGEF